MLFLIHFLENVKVFGTRVNHYQLHVCHSMLLASKICNNRDGVAVANHSLREIVGRSPGRSRGVAVQSDSLATQRFHVGFTHFRSSRCPHCSATVPLREFWKLTAT